MIYIEVPCCDEIVTLSNIPPAGSVITCPHCAQGWQSTFERDGARRVTTLIAA